MLLGLKALSRIDGLVRPISTLLHHKDCKVTHTEFVPTINYSVSGLTVLYSFLPTTVITV